MTHDCKICGAKTSWFAQAQLLYKYTVDYFQCSHCGFVQTETPYWLEEAYSSAIAHSDVGLVYRNLELSQFTNRLIFNLFDHNAKFLDYGGGYGLFVRLLRDAGFDFYWYDKFAENLFAKGFEASAQTFKATQSQQLFELVTAFEVFEHLLDPVEELRSMLQFSGNILFTTELLPSHNPKPGEWWYYCLEEGQHISFFTLRSLQELAQQFGLNLYSSGESTRPGTSLHLFTDQNISAQQFQAVLTGQCRCAMKPSLLRQDCDAVRQQIRQQHLHQRLDQHLNQPQEMGQQPAIF